MSTKYWALIDGDKVKIVVQQDDQPSVYTDNGKFWVECENTNGPGDSYINGQFIKSIPPSPPLPDIITKVAMISRFTSQEYVGIISATKTDVEVQAWYDLFYAASRVDLQDQRTIAGINSLVGKNLLTQARADEILTAPVQPNERP